MQHQFISFQNATLKKVNHVIFKNFNWEIKAHENWAIIGPNGSGKSTLVEALANKIPVFEGKVDFHFLEKGLVRDFIELVPKDYSANRILEGFAQYYQQRFNVQDAENSPTVREFLTNRMKPIGTIDERSVQLAAASYSDEELEISAEILKIKHLLDRKIMTLSNGETRRTLLTKSLLKRPKMIILDTPFVGIDKAGRKLLHEGIEQISKNGIQIVLITSADEIPSCIHKILEIKGDGIHFFDKSEYLVSAKKENNFVFPEDFELENNPTLDFEFAVNMRNISVSYGGKSILKELNWQVRKGEKWALLGANGSGKSTLLSLINADNPQSYANDFDLFDRKRGTGESIWDIKDKIGFVSPELHLYFSKKTSVLKAVASGFFNTNGLYQAISESQKEKAISYLKLLHIENLSDKKFFEISTGQQRLVLLARALVKNPALLILDEPCQGLDAENVRYFVNIVDAISRKFDKTLIYVTHYEDEIPKCVNKTLEL